jgi:hypothetical protein
MKLYLLGKLSGDKVHAMHDFGYKQTTFVSACCRDFENAKIIDGNPNDITCGLCLNKVWDKLCTQQLKIIQKDEYDKMLPLSD